MSPEVEPPVDGVYHAEAGDPGDHNPTFMLCGLAVWVNADGSVTPATDFYAYEWRESATCPECRKVIDAGNLLTRRLAHPV